MDQPKLPTAFAPAERYSIEEVITQADRFSNEQIMHTLVASIFDIFLILNSKRQIVFANDRLAAMVGVDDATSLLGLRPGEALGCSHATETEGGCGTTEFCRECGAVRAILESQRGNVSIQECRISRNDGKESLDLRVWATPLQKNGEMYTVIAIMDIADEKRRRALERIFFHDVLNIAGGLYGYAQLLLKSPETERDEYKATLLQLTRQILEEIAAQRDLTAAESNDLVTHPYILSSHSVLKEIAEKYANHPVGTGRTVVIDPESKDAAIQADPKLLRRVIGNMLKNALEASSKREIVTLGSSLDGDTIIFWVHNNGCMTESVKRQIFQRSFSTKSSDRGLGTYSMKLLGERYLKGTVAFTSSVETGTTFSIRLPMKMQTSS